MRSKKNLLAVTGDNSCALGSLVALLAIKATHSRHVTVMSSSYRCSSPACNLQLAIANACSCCDFFPPAAYPLTHHNPLTFLHVFPEQNVSECVPAVWSLRPSAGQSLFPLWIYHPQVQELLHSEIYARNIIDVTGSAKRIYSTTS